MSRNIRTKESEIAPLPFSLSALQIEAAKKYGLSAQEVLDICQKLYETHKLITYPRSDSRYLPDEHFAGRHAVLNAIAVHQPELTEFELPELDKKTVAGMTKSGCAPCDYSNSKNGGGAFN